MTDIPSQINQTATIVNKVIAGANSAGVQLVESLIIADEPWMGEPVIKSILGDLLGWLDGYLSKAEQSGATFAIIEHQGSSDKTQMSEAINEVAVAEKLGVPDAIKKALQDYAAAQSAVVNYRGSAPTQ